MNGWEIDFEWPLAQKYELQPVPVRRVTEEERERENVERRKTLLALIGPEKLRESERRWAAEPKEDPRKHWLYGVPENELPLYLGRIMPVGESKDRRPKTETMERAVKVLFGALHNRQVPFHKVALKVVQSLGTQMGDSGDHVRDWYYIAEKIGMIFEGRERSFGKEYRWPDPATWDVGEVRICLVPDKNNNRILALRPGSIHDALILCAARMIATGTAFSICEQCKTPFLSGGHSRKRGDSKFCSDPCRYSYHNERRR